MDDVLPFPTPLARRGRGLLRFAKYSGIGVSTLLFDLALLAFLTEMLQIHYLVAAALAFLAAVSVHYVLSRRLVFHGTSRSMRHGYAIFLGIAVAGLLIITGSLYVMVDLLGWHYLASRVLIAGAVGVWNYLMNLHVNFRVAGR